MSSALGHASLWAETLPPAPERAPLDGSTKADVAIVGAGYTGLWTAYYLARHQPDLRVVVLDAERVGFGASGRNGGWAISDVSIRRDRLAARHGRSAVVALLQEMCATVDEVGRVAEAEGIDCHFAKGGSLSFATSPAHVDRLRRWVRWEHEWGFGEEDFHWLDRVEAEERARPQGLMGAVETPHCSALHPARLAAGLAAAVERRGVVIHERTRATSLQPGLVQTEHGDVEAAAVLRCTEAFTAALAGARREVIPVYSLMVATEPLPDSVWDRIGLASRQTFHDGRHLVVYGQRTVDGRFAFGGRGAPYHYGSSIRPSHDLDDRTHAGVEGVLRRLFPQIGGARVTHRWGGAVAMPRDLQASIAYDPATGLGRAGGYVGLGVAASNLAGRTLADLVLRRPTDLTRLPWVGHRSRRWEPEPLRWVGVNALRALAPAADRVEERTGRRSKVLGGILDWFVGH